MIRDLLANGLPVNQISSIYWLTVYRPMIYRLTSLLANSLPADSLLASDLPANKSTG